ncbi:MAG: ATP-binding protein [Planctomycetes bacterium]|nr:ATP-binding protein [Planctomycetota bacterium]
MYPRILTPPPDKSFFLFGPRGTGKTAWVKATLPGAAYIDLLEAETHARLLADPGRLDSYVTDPAGWVVIDEVQRVPALLDEVHRLIEAKRMRFALTGSSARKLRQKGTNLLAGRALTRFMHPFTASELADDFRTEHAIAFGCLPPAWVEADARGFLASYVTTYLREEIQQEGLTRNLGAFTRFLEAASCSQAAVLNVAEVARECAVDRKVVANYFTILEDLLLAVRLPVFKRRAQRALVTHPKFFFFDAGVYRAIRPRGPLDSPDETGGLALETLVLQQLRALNDAFDLGYSLSYWRTQAGNEVDFVLYGERGLLALEVTASRSLRSRDLAGLRAFGEDYPMARRAMIYGGSRSLREGSIDVWSIDDGVRNLREWLQG